MNNGIRNFVCLVLTSLAGFACNRLAPVEMQVPSSPSPASTWWRPALGLTWQWQLDGEVDTSIDAQVYDLDLYVDQAVIDELHARGVKLICYISVGSYEDWRPDADLFPGEVLGKNYMGWPGESWLDIRRVDLLAPIMTARLDLCAARGFDGVEPDNIEIYDSPTGFPLTYADQLTYARWLAAEAHARGLAIGLKNAPDMVTDSLAFFDFAIIEDAYYYEWIDSMLPFIAAGKPVFAAEYTDLGVNFESACTRASREGVSLILKDRALSAFRMPCP
ncbi:MAG: endo alpha-1,4 polygalactosaminidase [Anaerolineaceae bacterium]|nr:endo alpha-1,4 polygalactosaminidase [Anaerolineaceae bacterium]